MYFSNQRCSRRFVFFFPLCVLLAIPVLCFYHNEYDHTTKDQLRFDRFESKHWLPLQLNGEDLAQLESTRMTFYVFLKYLNTDAMHQELMEVSTPGTNRYGQYLSVETLKAKYSMPKKAVSSVVSLFKSLENAEVSLSESTDILKVTANVGAIQRVLRTTISPHVRMSSVDGNMIEKRILRTTEPIQLPEGVSDSIAFISLNTPASSVGRASLSSTLAYRCSST